MKQSIKTLAQSLKRPVSLLVAIGFVFGSASGIVEAAANGAQVQYRSIKMSDNAVSGGTVTSGVGSGTGVSYRVTFNAATSYTIKGVVVDFCSGTGGTPFIGDGTCAAPTGFTVGSTPAINTSDYQPDHTNHPEEDVTGLGSGWTAAGLNSNAGLYQTFSMTNSTGTALTAGSTYTFAINGVTNPSDLGTFYARLITYTDATVPPAYTHSAPGSYQDYGGFALSTAQIVQVTAKVQETLTFCVSGNSLATGAPTAPASNSVAPLSCSDTTPAAITLGHGTNDTLDTSAIDSNTIWTIASTNALHGVTVRMHNSNACGGLSTDAGVTCLIPGAGAGAGTPGPITQGTAAFGMHCYPGVVLTGGTGAVACDPNYYDTTTNSGAGQSPLDYGMDYTTVGNNVTTTYGDQVASSTAPVNSIENQYDFAATASNTTPAGIYTANLSMIATGTF